MLGLVRLSEASGLFETRRHRFVWHPSTQMQTSNAQAMQKWQRFNHLKSSDRKEKHPPRPGNQDFRAPRHIRRHPVLDPSKFRRNPGKPARDLLPRQAASKVYIDAKLAASLQKLKLKPSTPN